MIDIEYKINPRKCTFQTLDNIIYLGGTGYDRLTDKQQDILVSDGIIHEFMHILLTEMFTDITSDLFEFIGDKLLNTNVLKKVISSDDMLWSESIREEGNKAVYDRYMIDNIDLIQSYLVCNYRGNKDV